jgi:hypothetical protein
MRLLTLLRNSLLCAAKSARIIGTQEYLQIMTLTALVRGARGHSGRENRLLNSGPTQNLIISVVRCAEISGYSAFQITCSQIRITSEIGNSLRANRTIRALLKIYKNIFRIPENLNYYSEKDHRVSERKFLRYSLEQRKIEMGRRTSRRMIPSPTPKDVTVMIFLALAWWLLLVGIVL